MCQQFLTFECKSDSRSLRELRPPVALDDPSAHVPTMIPARFAPIFIGLFLSGIMSCLVSGIATWRAVWPVDGFLGLWMLAWLNAWAVAFPAILVFAPLVRRLVGHFTKDS